jgi:hypothetical protein
MRDHIPDAERLKHLVIFEVNVKQPIGLELYPLLDHFVILRGQKRIEPLRRREAPAAQVR